MTKLGKDFGFVEFDVGDAVQRIDVLVAHASLQDEVAAAGPPKSAEMWREVMAVAAAGLMGEDVSDWSAWRTKTFWDAVYAELDRLKKAEPGSVTPA